LSCCSLKPLDIEFMKQLHTKVNIVPLIAKADTMTVEECRDFKKTVSALVRINAFDTFDTFYTFNRFNTFNTFYRMYSFNTLSTFYPSNHYIHSIDLIHSTDWAQGLLRNMNRSL